MTRRKLVFFSINMSLESDRWLGLKVSWLFLSVNDIYFSSDDFIVKFCFILLCQVNDYKSLTVLREFPLSRSKVSEVRLLSSSPDQ